MQLKILSALALKSILKNTRFQRKGLKDSLFTWIKLDRLQKNGTQAKKESKSIEKLGLWLTLTLCQYLKNANNAITNFLQKKWLTLIYSVQINANQHGEGKTALMTLKKYARIAKKSILPINTLERKHAAGNVEVYYSGVAEKVYDLTIEDEPEFFANGVLVHNCIDALRYSLNDKIKKRSGSF